MMHGVEDAPRAALVVAPRPVAASVEELLDGVTRLGDHRPVDARSGAAFERVSIDGEPGLVKYVHPDSDFTMRVSGDIGCRPLRVWAAGLMDLAPDLIDHAHLGAAPWGRNGWGVALLMRDLQRELVPPDDDPIPEAQHLAFLDHCAGLCARSWGWDDHLGLLPHRLRWAWFGPDQMDGEAALGFPEPVPRIATEGWLRFATSCPPDVARVVDDLRRDTGPLSEAVLATPSCFLHGDWKLGNLGTAADGRTTLIDWAYPGTGPAAHELAWYLALNRARLPRGHTKESTAIEFRSALERHGIATDGWWERQLGLCLLGAVVQFGWEKALGEGPDQVAEMEWWVEAARVGARSL